MGKRSLVLIMLLVSLGSHFFVFAETVRLKSGQTIEGKIIEETDEYIKIDFQGVPLTYSFDEVDNINGRLVYTRKSNFQKASSSYRKDPKDIFREISPAIVYITNKTLAEEQYLGSGFIVDETGILVTNYHLMQYAKESSVRLRDGRVFPITGVIYHNAERDVCIFKIDAQNLPTIPLGNSDSLEIGETIYCIGNPLGLDFTFSNGMLSGTREFESLKWLQFSAPVSPGNSGGPLINPQGEAVGIVTFIMTEGQNLNFASPINEIKPFVFANPQMTFQQFVDNISQVDYYVMQAFQRILAKDLNGALKQFKKALEIDPNSFDANDYIGGLYCAYLDRCQEALPYLEKAIEIEPNKPGPYNDLAVVYSKAGKHEEAIKYYEKALQINPNDSMYNSNIGQAYNILGKYQEALPYLQRAVQLAPVWYGAYLNLGIVYGNLGQFPESANNLRHYLEIEPDNATAWGYFGAALAQLGDYVHAKEAYLKAKELFLIQNDEETAQKMDKLLSKIP